MNPGYKPLGREEILVRILEDGCVLLELETKITHVLNAPAAFIWDCCDGTRPLSAIAQELAKLAHDPPPAVLEDVSKTVETFLELGLLQHPPGKDNLSP